MASSTTFAGKSLSGTLGVTFVGICLSSMLFGVTCLQTFTYYRSARAKRDPWSLWGLVAILLVLDSAHQAIVMHVVYTYLVMDWDNAPKVIDVVWSLPTEFMFSVILSLVLNGFLTFRLWKCCTMSIASTKYYLTGIAVVLTLANAGTNFAFAIRSYTFHTVSAAETVLRPQGLAGLILAAANEAMLSFSLAYYLHTCRTGLPRSNDIITKLIALTVSTGMLTTFFHVADFISYVAAPNSLYILFFTFINGKLYANCLLTTLNSREYVLGTGDGQGPPNHETISFRLPSELQASLNARQSDGWYDARVSSPHAVHIGMERFVVADPIVPDTGTKYESV